VGDLGLDGDNTETNLNELEYEDINRIRLAQDTAH
jgi:hypothetical protein